MCVFGFRGKTGDRKIPGIKQSEAKKKQDPKRKNFSNKFQ